MGLLSKQQRSLNPGQAYQDSGFALTRQDRSADIRRQEGEGTVSMHRMGQLLACGAIAAAVPALAGCANLPVQDSAYASPAGYNYSPNYGDIHGDYAPDGVYVGSGRTTASPMGLQSYVIPTPAPSSPNFPQQTQLAYSSLPDPGAPVFGPGGIAGTVTSNNGSFATVTPQGGGAPGIIISQGNGTGLLSVPGSAPTVVLTRP